MSSKNIYLKTISNVFGTLCKHFWIQWGKCEGNIWPYLDFFNSKFHISFLGYFVQVTDRISKTYVHIPTSLQVQGMSLVTLLSKLRQDKNKATSQGVMNCYIWRTLDIGSSSSFTNFQPFWIKKKQNNGKKNAWQKNFKVVGTSIWMIIFSNPLVMNNPNKKGDFSVSLFNNLITIISCLIWFEILILSDWTLLLLIDCSKPSSSDWVSYSCESRSHWRAHIHWIHIGSTFQI